MNILKAEDRWFVFNVREMALKDLKSGSEVTLEIPALGLDNVKAKVYYIKDMGDYAVWRATKVTGEYDVRTFEVRLKPVQPVADLRPGMSVIMK